MRYRFVSEETQANIVKDYKKGYTKAALSRKYKYSYPTIIKALGLNNTHKKTHPDQETLNHFISTITVAITCLAIIVLIAYLYTRYTAL